MTTREEREQRRQAANELLDTIAGCGRKFFRHGERVARIETDERGLLWFIDAGSGKRVWLHSKWGRWRGFTEGGTLQDLVKHLKNFIWDGTPVPGHSFGPWPDWYCGGDLWGYGDDMEIVREAAKRLGIVR